MTEPESSDLEKSNQGSGKESRKLSVSDCNTDTSASIIYVTSFNFKKNIIQIQIYSFAYKV